MQKFINVRLASQANKSYSSAEAIIAINVYTRASCPGVDTSYHAKVQKRENSLEFITCISFLGCFEDHELSAIIFPLFSEKPDISTADISKPLQLSVKPRRVLVISPARSRHQGFYFSCFIFCVHLSC